MRTGTSHFASFELAVRYYAKQGIDRADVLRKTNEGEITPGQRLIKIDGGSRYAIEEA